MSAVFLGDFSASAPHDTKYSFAPFRGWITTWTYTGTEASIFTIADAFSISNTGANLDLTQDGPLWKLVVTFDYKNDGVSAETPVNTWELLGNDLQKSLYEHPRTIALKAPVIVAIKLAVQSVETSDISNAARAYSDATGAITEATQSAGTSQSDALDCFDLLVKGTTHYSVSEFVLRRTQTASNSYTGHFGLGDIGKIYTTTQVTTEAEVPSTLVFAISEITEPAAQSGYAWTWLKKSPQINFVAGSKIQVTQEYVLEQWSTYPYPAKT